VDPLSSQWSKTSWYLSYSQISSTYRTEEAPPPPDPDQVSQAMTVRVADCRAAYAALTARGAAFLTPPHDWGGENRCFLRDPDGHLVEISESVPT
jgi:catechol 2,3-dioxygenase-like lactoylglutathione lyase family enzyme